MLSSSTTVTALALCVAQTLAAPAPPSSYPSTSWPGFTKLRTLFTFGDSYTTTGFNVSLEQPSSSNPLGNPPYPGWTSANGPNWVDLLTVKYNASRLQTVNLAYGGATVNKNLVAQYLPTVLDFNDQVTTEFLPYYSHHANSSVAWDPSSSLFAFFFGINDVGNSYANSPSGPNNTLNTAIFAEYTRLVRTLYASGARNFLFLNVPPVDRSPLTIGDGKAAQALEARDIADFNARIATLAATVRSTWPGSKVFAYDTHTVFGQILDRPARFEQTKPLKNTTAYCTAYQNGTPDLDTYDASCGVRVDQYFWLNSLHPIYRVHDVIAQGVAGLLRRG